ncbi:MAG: GNAT family N-acetyltransferase [Coleofasciculaceae cyanobacterium SM2_3_26]|nr:GNAT family N-acetyltransferase [Coleofasciculaceae cyanobacterium SM2_3_26]
MARRSSNLWLGDRGASLYLSNLAVKAEYRRQGIALQLLDACEQIALGWGFDKLYLHVLENNQRARQLYAKAGFRPQRQRDCLLLQWLVQPKRLLLQKSLTPIYRATSIGSR